jgi:cellulose synthase/poly-beta-1,6-N-acetylglucosamine synthase-like glycosyltransferase
MNLAILVPLGIIGFFRWLSWLIRRVPAALYQAYDSDYSALVTVVTPVYQEDPEIFRLAIESWLANDVDEIICVIDVTDEQSQRVAAEYPVKVIITDVPGKRDALRRGWEAATSPIIALVDSDTLWARDVKRQVLKPFADRRIGGVGTRQNVHNPENVWQHINDMYLDYRYFDEIASQTRVGKAVSCLSGRTAVYRRELLVKISDDFMNERFMGLPCNSGEDKRLTSLTLKEGYLTYMQRTARVWSTFPKQTRMFFKQRLRWSRNTWRSDLRALFSGWIYRHKFLAFTTVDKAIGGFTLMISPIFMGFAIANSNWNIAAALGVWWWISRAAKHLPHLHRKPLHFFLIPVFVIVSFLVALTKIYALCTVRRQRWLTRDVAVVDGQLRRTGSAGAGDVDVSPAPSPAYSMAAGSQGIIDLRDPVAFAQQDVAP